MDVTAKEQQQRIQAKIKGGSNESATTTNDEVEMLDASLQN